MAGCKKPHVRRRARPFNSHPRSQRFSSLPSLSAVDGASIEGKGEEIQDKHGFLKSKINGYTPWARRGSPTVREGAVVESAPSLTVRLAATASERIECSS